MSRGAQHPSAQTRRSPLDAWFRGFSRAQAPPASAALRFEDLSARHRFGCKGPAAESWLSARGFKVPAAPNSAEVDSTGVLVARLATAEFLVEAVDSGAEQVHGAAQHLESVERALDVYPVPRSDLVLGIGGPAIDALLRQICSVNFTPLLERAGRCAGPVILTSMIGVGVVAWPRSTELGSCVTLWIDPSFAHYFWTTLLEVGRETGDLMIGGSNAIGD